MSCCSHSLSLSNRAMTLFASLPLLRCARMASSRLLVCPSKMTRHQLSGGAQGPDPEQSPLQDGPPDGGQLSRMVAGTMLSIAG
jgi:hypothetical protein